MHFDKWKHQPQKTAYSKNATYTTQTKTTERNTDRGCQGLEGERITCTGAVWGIPGQWTVLWGNCGSEHTTPCTCQNQYNCTP